MSNKIKLSSDLEKFLRTAGRWDEVVSLFEKSQKIDPILRNQITKKIKEIIEKSDFPEELSDMIVPEEVLPKDQICIMGAVENNLQNVNFFFFVPLP